MKLFEAGTCGYSLFRIPSLLATSSGRLIALCEARMDPESDSGRIHIVQRTSDDGGKTWSPLRVILSDGPNTVGNPCMVEHKPSGRIQLFFNGNLGSIQEPSILVGNGIRTVGRMESDDDGETWKGPWDMTEIISRPHWTWYACGPCHATCLPSGRLIIPCNHAELPWPAGAVSPYRSHLLLSDDGGSSWRIGAILGTDTNEICTAYLPDQSLYINMRSARRNGFRQISRSYDGGETVTETLEDPALTEPYCQGSCIEDADRLFFLNPSDRSARIRLALKMSLDGGRTWQETQVLCPGHAAYSDLQILGRTFHFLYETGNQMPYEWIEYSSLPLS